MPSPKVSKADVDRWRKALLAEAVVTRDALRDRGVKFFKRPLAMAGGVVVAAYYLVYLPPLNRAARVEADLAAAQATAQYADEYQGLKARLDGLQTKLPRTSDASSWILEEVRKTLREEGIVPISISPASEDKKGEYHFVSIQVRCSADYPTVARWISRIERNPSLLFIRELSLHKDDEPIGSNTADVTITTVIPAGGGG